MKTNRSLATLSLLTLIVAAGCGNTEALDSLPAPAAAPVSPASLAMERVLADVDTGRDPVATRAKLETLLVDGSLGKEERAPIALALARVLEASDRERAIHLLEDATALGDQAAEKRLFALLAGHEAPTWTVPAHDAVIADSARALARFFPAATPDKKVEISVVSFGGRDGRASDGLGTFAIGDALREKAVEACGLCDEVKTSVHTHSSNERYWSAIPRYAGRLEKSVVVLYVTEDTMPPERYAQWLALPLADLSAAVARGEGLVAVKERPGAPPLVTLAAPRAAQFEIVEGAFAAMEQLPKAAVPVKLEANLSVPEVRSGIRARFGGFKACYADLLKRRPAAGGKTEVAYTITGAGKLTELAVTFEGSLEEPQHRACVEKVLSTVRYPAWSKAPDAKITVRYPIVMNP